MYILEKGQVAKTEEMEARQGSKSKTGTGEKFNPINQSALYFCSGDKVKVGGRGESKLIMMPVRDETLIRKIALDQLRDSAPLPRERRGFL